MAIAQQFTDKQFKYGLKLLENVFGFKYYCKHLNDEELKTHIHDRSDDQYVKTIEKHNKTKLIKHLAKYIDDYLSCGEFIGIYMLFAKKEQSVFFFRQNYNESEIKPNILMYQKCIEFSGFINLRGQLTKLMERYSLKALQKLVNAYPLPFEDFFIEIGSSKYRHKLNESCTETMLPLYK